MVNKCVGKVLCFENVYEDFASVGMVSKEK